MSPAHDQQARITRYLLGDLPESDQQAFEESYFGDPALFDQVAIVESELVDDFVHGRLDESLHRKFEAHYLISGRLRDRVKFAEVLASASGRRVESSRIRASGIAASGRQSFTAFRPALALAALLIIGLGGWLFYMTREPGSKPGVATTAPPTEPRSAITTFAITLAPATRSQGVQPVAVSLPSDATDVEFQVTVREPDYDRMRIILRRLGGDEIQRDEFDARERSDIVVRLRISAARLVPGDYMLTLQGRRSSGEFEDARQSILRLARP